MIEIGDLARVASDDLAIFISNSGETQEVIKTLVSLQVIHHNNFKTAAIPVSKESTLANSTDLLLKVDVAEEADPTKLAPTS